MSAENEDAIPSSPRSARDDDPRADPLFRVAALAGVATLPLTLIAVTISDLNARADVNPGRPTPSFSTSWSTPAANRYGRRHSWRWRQWRCGSSSGRCGRASAAARNGWPSSLWSGASLSERCCFSRLGLPVAWVAADYEDAGAARFLMVAGWETARIAVAPALVMVGATTLAGVRYGVFGSGSHLRRNLHLPSASGPIPASPAGLMGLAVNVWVLVVALKLAFGILCQQY